MNADLLKDIRYIKGVGPARAEAFARSGVTTLYDLITFFPRTYEDRSIVKTLVQIVPEESCSVLAYVSSAPSVARIHGGMELLKFRVSDETGYCDVTYFNQSYLKSRFVKGQQYLFYGKFTGNLLLRSLTNPAFEEITENVPAKGRLVPVYPMTKGLTQKAVSSAVSAALELCLPILEETLPAELLKRNNLLSYREAIVEVHRPENYKNLQEARDRLVFEEMLTLQLGLLRLRGRRRVETGAKCEREADLASFYQTLSFSMTAAQKKATDEILRDLQGDAPMNRLLQGDVGSGKTVVAAAAAYYCAECGWQTAFLAPTEILAQQHYEKLTRMFSVLGRKVGLLTGSMSKTEKAAVYAAAENGGIDILISTHAALEASLHFQRLGLIICDEQHRFGVLQRAKLSLKGENPHILAMSATPIPRTLALMIYGDLDISVIDELPPGRQKIATHLIGNSGRNTINKFISERVALGKQGYIICPLVEESENVKEELKDVKNYVNELAAALPDLRIGLLHGRMKAANKETVMAEFVGGRLDVLVSTTVIEVGIDVPNANFIIIENAERFGLSQLHQLRGRVGRGSEKSYCILVSDAEGDNSRERLAVMTKTTSGFEIAQHDLELRGPGDFFGARQHGLPTLKLVDLGADTRSLKTAQEEAIQILRGDPALASPENKGLAMLVDRLFSHIEGNFLN